MHSVAEFTQTNRNYYHDTLHTSKTQAQTQTTFNPQFQFSSSIINCLPLISTYLHPPPRKPIESTPPTAKLRKAYHIVYRTSATQQGQTKTRQPARMPPNRGKKSDQGNPNQISRYSHLLYTRVRNARTKKEVKYSPLLSMM